MAKEDWQRYFNDLNRTISSLEKRVSYLEKQIRSQSNPHTARKVFGWICIVISILLFLVSMVFDDLLMWAILSLVGGLILLLYKSDDEKTPSTSQSKPLQEELPIKEKRIAQSVPKQRPAKQAEKTSNLEADIGKKWLPKIGVVSIVLGIAWFVVYAIQNKWIGPTGQVAIGILAGLCIVVAGEMFYQRKFQNYGLTLVGGGFAIIYFALFAAHRFYNLIPLYVDITALTAIIIGVVIFSMRYDSLIIAAQAFALGYLVPLLTSSVDLFFLIYAFALTIGVTVLACARGWKLLGLGGMGAMYITHFLWLDSYHGAYKSWLHLGFLFAYILLFAAMALRLKDRVHKDIENLASAEKMIAGVFLLTYLFFFALDFHLLAWNIVLPLLMLLGLLAFFALRFSWSYFLPAGVALTYLVHLSWLEQNFNPASVMFNLGSSLAYFLLFSIVLLFAQSKRPVSCVIAALLNSVLFAGANLWPIFTFDLGWGGLFSAALAIYYLLLTYFSYGKNSAYFSTFLALCFGYLTLTVPLQFNQEWIAISWALLALILVWLSLRLEEVVIRFAGSAVSLLALGRLLFYDTQRLSGIGSGILHDTRLLVFGALILAAYAIAYLYNKNKDEFENYDAYIKYVNGAYVIAAILLTTLLIWLEVWDLPLAQNAKNLWISIGFIIHAIIILIAGFAKQVKFFRVMGLALLGLAIIKVFLYDLSNMETGYRIISFIVLGIITLLAAFLYTKFKQYL